MLETSIPPLMTAVNLSIECVTVQQKDQFASCFRWRTGWPYL